MPVKTSTTTPRHVVIYPRNDTLPIHALNRISLAQNHHSKTPKGISTTKMYQPTISGLLPDVLWQHQLPMLHTAFYSPERAALIKNNSKLSSIVV
jgi:hypothetical protein